MRKDLPPPSPPVGRPGSDGRGFGVALSALWRLVARVLFVGPDPRPRDSTDSADGAGSADGGGSRPSVGSVWLPWPARWLLVLAAWLVGTVWADAGIGEQLAFGLDYAALIAVSLTASYWLPILLVNLILSVAWFIPFRARQESPALWRVLHVVTFINRQVGHIEAFAVWLAIAFVAWPRLSFQIPFATAVFLLGPPIINGLALASGSNGHRPTARNTGNLNWRRRPYIYAATLIGIVALALQAPRQAGKLVPVAAAIVIGGVLPRFLRALMRDRNVRREAGAGDATRLGERAAFRSEQMRWASLDVAFGPTLLVLLAIGTIVFAWQQRRAYDEALDKQINPAGMATARACQRDPGGPTKPELSLFIVSDSQLHELGGRRFPGQIELADVFVPVAIRPVELDLLSVATLARFASVYRDMGRNAAATGAPPPAWAHLGDLADLACVGELERAADMFTRFDARLAGVSPGNHDKSFTGNFYWSPFWDVACRQRAEKRESDAILHRAAEPQLLAGAAMRAVAGVGSLAQAITGRGGALVTVAPLGVVHDVGRERGVIAVFLDTADERAFDFGIAGLYGTVSRQQVSTLLDMIRDLEARSPAPYRDPLYVLFGHHPLDELTNDSQERVSELVAQLDGTTDGTRDGTRDGTAVGHDGSPPTRVLAIVTSHTHIAQASFHCTAGRFLREIVVGSTIDPPQEAALLTIGADANGRPALRVRTMQAVAREDRTCGTEAGEPPAIPALRCQQIMGTLAEHPDCRGLFEADGAVGSPSAARPGPRPDCQVLERRMSLTDRLKAARNYRGPASGDGIKREQIARTRRLLACVCRGGQCKAPEEAVRLESDRAYHDLFLAAIESGDAATRAARAEELTCLAWAASAVQAHKASGMTMADALRCAFDDATVPAAKEFVASLEARSCR